MASGAAAYVCYHSPWGLGVFPAAYFLFGKCFKRRWEHRRRAELNLEFKDYLYAVSGALSAGYSAERAFVSALGDVRHLHGEDCILLKRLGRMEQRLFMQETIETILRDFAAESGSEDIENFVEIFCFAKRGGGDFIHLIAVSVGRICDKMEVTEEIYTVMAEKRLEQNIMCVVPAGVLLFFRLTSPEFIGLLYGNLTGILIMTAALVLYAAAFVLGVRMMEVEV